MTGTDDNRRSGEHGHVPVMADRIADLLTPGIEAMGDKAVVLDATLGAGGHTEHLLQRFPSVHIIGLDRDPVALGGAVGRLSGFGDRFGVAQVRFDQLSDAIADGDGAVFELARAHGLAGALFDLGVSSMQLDQVDRGFAYRVDAPLDMRMDPSGPLTAADVLNTYSHGELARVLNTYGEERFAGKIASAILREREKEPFTTSARLVELLYSTIPAAARRSGGHPAKRTFQALRIEVNRELESIENALPAVCDELAVGGTAVFMSYQSLEDRIVKAYFAKRTTSTTPPDLPMELPGHEPSFRLATRGAEKATKDEIELNARAAPARVRAITRIRQDSAPPTLRKP
ncbi:16S rRNA (cytosine(1402)-N(4))-methyltransferase RsmH [Corynebacterium sp. TAE3-ERU12]|uniref:16S rRNA (cytosine(1402)-N(4))-methyltransferase RsmH n=1 Tax=Corynebacterium sp. TAE3-ERU12 TaxID=2849491 RepID=UPI001C451FB6|nr:16S rRNA (cytosine(1402)-N(4))-methyltransferase RsmH [Corynebacterium sp. TAE3-ERU12]MBV7296229.1 16S rRNA (cytosine(1402)-N(4))-methyltransferase RsmH [Corynebacterium sp. TAE3-ERU12]